MRNHDKSMYNRFTGRESDDLEKFYAMPKYQGAIKMFFLDALSSEPDCVKAMIRMFARCLRGKKGSKGEKFVVVAFPLSDFVEDIGDVRLELMDAIPAAQEVLTRIFVRFGVLGVLGSYVEPGEDDEDGESNYSVSLQHTDKFSRFLITYKLTRKFADLIISCEKEILGVGESQT